MSSELRQAIDRAVENANGQIEFDRREQFMRAKTPTAIVMLLIVPIASVCFQVARYTDGLPAGFGFSWLWLLALTVAVPVAWLLFRTIGQRIDVDRRQVLGKMDAQLGSCERLVTADEFLTDANRDAFKQAAVEDAAEWAQQAKEQSLTSDAHLAISFRWSLLAVPGAMILLTCSWWLAGFARSGVPNSAASLAALVTENPAGGQTPDVNQPIDPQVDPLPEPSPSERPSDRKAERRANRQGTAANVIADDAQQSRGKLADGETSESQQSSNPSSARGEPSSSGQPSTSDSETKRKPKKEQKQQEEKDRPQREREENEQPSGSTAGQGSSRGSNNNAAPSDWSSKSQTATPDDEDIEDEDDVDDEDEEQKSRGGVQPNMRDRRTPVNRDLQIGFGTNRPNPDANGRGGPGGQKKSRGVASLVLGVPIPDRVTGQPNKGRIRITQQRITPEAEQSESVAAEDRGTRNAPVGPIAHPDFSPWLQEFVRQYFLDRRNMFPLSPSSEDQTTTSSTESNPLQS